MSCVTTPDRAEGDTCVAIDSGIDFYDGKVFFLFRTVQTVIFFSFYQIFV